VQLVVRLMEGGKLSADKGTAVLQQLLSPAQEPAQLQVSCQRLRCAGPVQLHGWAACAYAPPCRAASCRSRCAVFAP